MKKKLLLSIVFLMMSGLSIWGLDVVEKKPFKFSTSISSLFAFGDLNFSCEKYLGRTVSVVAAAHYIPQDSGSDEAKNLFKHPDYRGTLGLRSYLFFFEEQDSRPFGTFISLNAGVNGMSNGLVPSMELWAGSSNKLSEALFSELGVGVGRLLKKGNEIGDLAPLASFSLGFLF